MTSGDGSVVDSEVWVFHHFHRQTSICSLVVDFGAKVDIDVEVIVVTEEIWKHRIHGETLEIWKPQKVGTHIGLPVWRQQDNCIIFNIFQRSTKAFIAPSQLLPTAFGNRFILWRVFSIDQMRWMRSQATCYDFTLRHSASQALTGYIGIGVQTKHKASDPRLKQDGELASPWRNP